MKFKFLSIFLICLMIFSTVGAASATIADNNQEIKDNNSVIVVNNLTVNGIQAAVDKAQNGCSILINGSVTDESSVNCNKSLSIVGHDCVLNKVHWNQNLGVVDFRNITFSGNKGMNTIGNANYSEDNVTLNSCSFINNYDIHKQLSSSSGSAIYSTGNVCVNNSNFINNGAGDYGGAIYASGYVNISNSNFKDNNVTGYDGGAIYSKSTVCVNNSSFINNNANVDGGAIYAKSAVTVENSSFNNNSAYGAWIVQCYGGAIRTDNSLKAYYSNFTNNYADDSGGALWTDDDCYIDHCLFNNNGANDDNGGAIYMENECNMFIMNSAFYGNFAGYNGGAIYNDDTGSYLYLDSSNAFENNSCCKEGTVAFSYGYYGSVKGNWWGTYNPDWNYSRGLLVEHTYNPFKENIKHSDPNPLDYNPLNLKKKM